MSEYQELIAVHRALQKQLADQPDTVDMEIVLRLVAQTRDAGEHIGDSQQREQLRAILKHWGAFVYERRGEYPATQLAPHESLGVRRVEKASLGLRLKAWWDEQGLFTKVALPVLLGLIVIGLCVGVSMAADMLLPLLQTLTPTPELPTEMPAVTVVCPQMSVGRRSPHTTIQRVLYSLNNGEPQIASSEEVLIVQPGDSISIVDLQYCSETAGSTWDEIQGEAYFRENGVFDYGDGRFTIGVPILPGEHPTGAFDGSWTIQAGWDRLVIVLIHYYQGGHEIDHRFFINLDVQ
jgi:hypothetical protein